MIKYKATVYCDTEGCKANQTILFRTNNFREVAAQLWTLRWHLGTSGDAKCPVHSGGTKF